MSSDDSFAELIRTLRELERGFTLVSNETSRLDERVRALTEQAQEQRSSHAELRQLLSQLGEELRRGDAALRGSIPNNEALRAAIAAAETLAKTVQANLAAHIGTSHGADAKRHEDLQALLQVVKPHERTGLVSAHQKDHNTLWRWVFGIGGVLALLSTLAVVAKLWFDIQKMLPQ